MAEFIASAQTYLGLHHGRINEETLFRLLLDSELTTLTIIAYYHYLLRCRHLKVDQDGLHNNALFLHQAKPEYTFLYVGMEFPPPTDQAIVNKIGLGAIRYYTDAAFGRFIRILLGHQKRVTLDELPLALQARQYHVEVASSFDVFWKYLLQYNAVSQLGAAFKSPPSQDVLELVLSHCDQLRISSPYIWTYLSGEYMSLFRGWLDRNLIKFNLHLHRRINGMFPDLFPSQCQSLSTLALKIYYMKPFQAGYYLGFPIVSMVPSADDIMLSLLDLSTLGRDKYIEQFIDRNIRYHQARLESNTILIPSRDYTFRFVNDRDSLHNNVFSYSPRDIHSFAIEGGKFFLFTAAELHGLLQTRRNFYTNQELPESILEFIRREINDRTLPPSQPLPDLLEELDSS